jgi:hypothetical protein
MSLTAVWSLYLPVFLASFTSLVLG